MLKHASSDFQTGRPLAAPLACVGLILIQVAGIRLYNMAVFQKEQPRLFCWHAYNKSLGFRQNFLQASHRGTGVNRRVARDPSKIRLSVTRHAANLVDDALGREA
jgi:hypothetical protein